MDINFNVNLNVTAEPRLYDLFERLVEKGLIVKIGLPCEGCALEDGQDEPEHADKIMPLAVTTPAVIEPAQAPAAAPAPAQAAPVPAADPNIAPTPAPVQAAPAPAQTASSVTLEELSRAGAALATQGKMAELMAIMPKYGVQALTQLKPEQYAAVADDLRALGAQI